MMVKEKNHTRYDVVNLTPETKRLLDAFAPKSWTHDQAIQFLIRFYVVCAKGVAIRDSEVRRR